MIPSTRFALRQLHAKYARHFTMYALLFLVLGCLAGRVAWLTGDWLVFGVSAAALLLLAVVSFAMAVFAFLQLSKTDAPE